MLTNLTALLKRATTRTNIARRLHVYPPVAGNRRYEVIMVTYADVIAKRLRGLIVSPHMRRFVERQHRSADRTSEQTATG